MSSKYRVNTQYKLIEAQIRFLVDVGRHVGLATATKFPSSSPTYMSYLASNTPAHPCTGRSIDAQLACLKRGM